MTEHSGGYTKVGTYKLHEDGQGPFLVPNEIIEFAEKGFGTAVGEITIEPEWRTFECSKGHTWKRDALTVWQTDTVRMIVSLPDNQLHQIEKLCPYCMAEFWDKMLSDVGRVEEK